MTRTWVRALAAPATVLLATGATLGVSTAATAAGHHRHGITKKLAAAQYEADDGPFASARTAYASAFTAWYSAHEPSSETTSFVDPFVTACRTFEHQLQTQQWPAGDKAAVRRFASSLGVIATDVASLPTVTLATGKAWAAKLDHDSDASIADAGVLRSKLGLAPTG